jgi:hypothetical protein
VCLVWLRSDGLLEVGHRLQAVSMRQLALGVLAVEFRGFRVSYSRNGPVSLGRSGRPSEHALGHVPCQIRFVLSLLVGVRGGDVLFRRPQTLAHAIGLDGSM